MLLLETHERLLLAVGALATEPGRIRERLANAYAFLMPLEAKDWPDQLQGEFSVLKERMAHLLGPEGDIAALAEALSEDEAVEIAEHILFLDYVHRDWLEGVLRSAAADDSPRALSVPHGDLWDDGVR